ncbi:MAG: type II toxin-antitoxin system CcdA family antitoxin [Kofleriaceae bacterium]
MAAVAKRRVNQPRTRRARKAPTTDVVDWVRENERAIANYNDFIETHGVFSDRFTGS